MWASLKFSLKRFIIIIFHHEFIPGFLVSISEFPSSCCLFSGLPGRRHHPFGGAKMFTVCKGSAVGCGHPRPSCFACYTYIATKTLRHCSVLRAVVFVTCLRWNPSLTSLCRNSHVWFGTYFTLLFVVLLPYQRFQVLSAVHVLICCVYLQQIFSFCRKFCICSCKFERIVLTN